MGQSASSEHTASRTAALCGRQREPRSLRGHPRPQVTPHGSCCCSCSPSMSQTLRSSDAPQNSLHLCCQDRGSKDALVLSAEICASTLGTSGLKGFYLLSLVTNMYDLYFILSETTADSQPCTASYAATYWWPGSKANLLGEQTTSSTMGEQRRMKLLPKSNAPLTPLGHLGLGPAPLTRTSISSIWSGKS